MPPDIQNRRSEERFNAEGELLLSFDDPVHLRSEEAVGLPRAFIRTTQSNLYDRLLNRAREAGWYCREIGGGHYSMFTQPEVVASTLNELSE